MSESESETILNAVPRGIVRTLRRFRMRRRMRSLRNNRELRNILGEWVIGEDVGEILPRASKAFGQMDIAR